MKDEFDELSDAELWAKWIESPEGRARERLHGVLTDLSMDPEVAGSPICREFLRLMIRISPADAEADSIFDLVEPLGDYFRKRQAMSGAAGKLANDPKQIDKALVRECWNAWQEEPSRYKGKAAFARDMLDKFESLRSQQVIEGWCREWAKEVSQPAK